MHVGQNTSYKPKHLLKGLFALCFVTPSFIQAQTQSVSEKATFKNATFEVSDYLMRGASYEEGPDNAKFVQLQFNPKLKLKLHKVLELTAGASLSLTTSRDQSRFDAPNLNFINPNTILLSYIPDQNFKISLGAINQEHLDSPALVQSDLAFLGAIVSYGVQYENFEIKAKTQYTIPSSTSLESDRTGSEETPTFQTQGVELNWKPKVWANLTANINHFSYSKLPSVVAFNSGRTGNEVVGTNKSESFFAHNFDGFSQSYKFDFDISKRLSPFLSLKSVDNLKAPSDRQRAQQISIGTNIHFKNLSLAPSFTSFYAESDSAPSVYTDARFGRTNREGTAYGFTFDFKKLGFIISTTYVNASLIEPDPIQSDAEYFEVYVGVANVKF